MPNCTVGTECHIALHSKILFLKINVVYIVELYNYLCSFVECWFAYIGEQGGYVPIIKLSYECLVIAKLIQIGGIHLQY